MILVSVDYKKLLIESLSLGDTLVTFITSDGSVTSSSTSLAVLSPFFRDLVLFASDHSQPLVILERLTGGRKTEAADTCVQLNCLLLATCASVLHPQQHTPLRISQAHRHPKRPRLALFNSGAATTQKIMGAGML